jgi:hypothetical protein
VKTIIILENTGNTYRYALWAAVPSARQAMYAVVGRVSAWKNASTAENAAIAAGQVVERVGEFVVDAGVTLATVRSQLVQLQADYQAEINLTNPWNRYGTFFDGTTWTSAGLA